MQGWGYVRLSVLLIYHFYLVCLLLIIARVLSIGFEFGGSLSPKPLCGCAFFCCYCRNLVFFGGGMLAWGWRLGKTDNCPLYGQPPGGIGAERSTRGGEMLPTQATVWRASGMRGDEAGRFREVEGVSIVAD